MDSILPFIIALVVFKVVLLFAAYLAFRLTDDRHERAHLLAAYDTPTERMLAERRAELLLSEMLTDQERAQLRQYGYLDVHSPSLPQRVYRVPRRPGKIQVLDDGRLVMSLCVQPTSVVPDADVLLMHKLMIEGNEAEYLSVANRF